MGLHILGYCLLLFLLHKWPATLFVTCSATDITIIELFNKTVICEKCRPGYKTSQLCLSYFQKHSYKRIKTEQFNRSYANNNFNISHCTACESGEFSDTFLVNQTCKMCKQCATGLVEERRCNSTSETKCKTVSNGSGYSKVIWILVPIIIVILLAFGACWFRLSRRAFLAQVKLNRPGLEEQELVLNRIP